VKKHIITGAVFILILGAIEGNLLCARKSKAPQSPDQVRLEQLNQRITKLEQEIVNADEYCESSKGYEQGPVCEYANEKVSAKGVELAAVKAERSALRKKMGLKKGDSAVISKKK
jgi:hypothetical protein